MNTSAAKIMKLCKKQFGRWVYMVKHYGWKVTVKP